MDFSSLAGRGPVVLAGGIPSLPLSRAHFYGLWEWDNSLLCDPLHHTENRLHPPSLACACAQPSGLVALYRDDHWTLNVLYPLMMLMHLNTCPGHVRVCNGGRFLFLNRSPGILTCLRDLCRESCYGNLSVSLDAKDHVHAISNDQIQTYYYGHCDYLSYSGSFYYAPHLILADNHAN